MSTGRDYSLMGVSLVFLMFGVTAILPSNFESGNPVAAGICWLVGAGAAAVGLTKQNNVPCLVALLLNVIVGGLLFVWGFLPH